MVVLNIFTTFCTAIWPGEQEKCSRNYKHDNLTSIHDRVTESDVILSYAMSHDQFQENIMKNDVSDVTVAGGDTCHVDLIDLFDSSSFSDVMDVKYVKFVAFFQELLCWQGALTSSSL